MRSFLIIFLSIVLSFNVSAQDKKFEKYFEDASLRIDYNRSGNTKKEKIEIKKMAKYNVWAGSKKNLIYPFDQGRLRIRVVDFTSGQLIYSKHFDSIFGEYQLTKKSQEGKSESFEEVQLIPFPRTKVIVYFDSRNKENKFENIFSLEVFPDKIKEAELKKNDIIEISNNGHCSKSYDLLFLSEGYTAEEKEQFINDARKFSETILKNPPFNKFKDQININAVFAPSEESGVDNPQRNISKKTLLGGTFNGLGDPGYLVVNNIFNIYDLFLQKPSDHFIVICNSKSFGANGIYNYYLTLTSKCSLYEKVIIHELGHYAGGLADEYYQTANFAYGTIYPENIEPVEPNITTLTDSKNVKWKEYLSPGIEIPTDWGKEKFDSLTNLSYSIYEEKQKEIKELKEKGLTDQIEERNKFYRNKISHLQRKLIDFISQHPLKDKIGVFEGAGHTSKGVYRPSLNSIMFMGDRFDTIGENVLTKIINYYLSGI